MCLRGAFIEAREFPIGVVHIDDVRILRIDGDVTAFRPSHRVPVAFGDLGMIRAARNGSRAAVLLRSVNVVRELVIGRHMIELRRRLVVPGAPCLACINADGCTLIGAQDHPRRFGRVDPQRMVIIAAGRALEHDEIPSAIGRAV